MSTPKNALVTVTGEALERVLDWTYPIWNEGLSREAYSRWTRGQIQTPWGRDHLTRVVLMCGSDPVASAKWYDLKGVDDLKGVGRPGTSGVGPPRIGPPETSGVGSRIVGIGAVFTPEAERGRGRARTLIEAICDEARGRGCSHALLFSEIGASFYERLGFTVIPQQIATLAIATNRRGAPAVLVRTAETRDLPEIAAIAARASDRAAFTLDRSPDFIAFGVTRKRLLAGLGPPGLRSLEFFVTEEGSRAVAYVVLTHGPKGIMIEDFGDRDPSGARVGAMLETLAARTPAEQPMRPHVLLPPPSTSRVLPPQVSTASERPADEIMMIRALGEGSSNLPGEAWYPHLDVF